MKTLHVRLATVCSFAAVILSVGLPNHARAQSNVNSALCDVLLGTTQAAYFPMQIFVSCLNSTGINTTLANEFLATAVTGMDMHAFGPQVPDTVAAVRALSVANGQSMFQFLLDVEGAFLTALDKHLLFSGTPYFDAMFVIRPMLFSFRMENGNQQLFVDAVYADTVINAMRSATSTFSGLGVQMPDYAAFETTVNKTVTSINGMSAMEYARRAATRGTGFLPTGAQLNQAAKSVFNFRLVDTYDLWNEGEVVQFSDGTSISFPRMLLKSAVQKGTRGDIAEKSGPEMRRRRQSSAQADSSRRAGTPAKKSDAFRYHGDGESVFASELHDDSRVSAASLDATNAVAAAAGLPLNEVVVRSGGSSEAATGARLDDVPTQNTVLWTTSLDDVGVAEIQSRQSGTVAYLQIKSFQIVPPQGQSVTLQDIDRIGNLIIDLTREAHNRGVSTLVLDLSSNFGGFVALQNMILRLLDPAYNIAWDESVDPTFPPITNLNNRNALWGRSYIRTRNLNGSPMGVYWSSILNQSYTFRADGTPNGNLSSNIGSPPWWQPTGGDGYTPNFLRMALFTSSTPFRPFTTIKVINDGLCGSSCCLMAERIKRYGITGASVEFIGFAGDAAASRFQMADFCGGSAATVTVMMARANIARHPFITGNSSRDDADVAIADFAWFARDTDSTPAQYDMQAFADRRVNDWTMIGSDDTPRERRMTALFGQPVAVASSAAPGHPAVLAVTTLAVLLAAVATW